MRILAVADEVDEALARDPSAVGPVELIVSCGDLPFEYLDGLARELDAPLVFVPGNHDPDISGYRVTRAGLRDWYAIPEPRIALCALNPHAGDGGRFGHEDDELLAPAAREAGIAGPFPADTVFVRAMRGAFDAVIAPYHDVGMTAIKVASFGSAVNVTLGLPFVRTSPDHGTAFDIAGQGIARPDSLMAAIRLAKRLAGSVPRPSRDEEPPASVYAGRQRPVGARHFDPEDEL